MMRKMSDQSRSVRRCSLFCAMLFVWGTTNSGLADEPSPLIITTGDTPTLRLNQDASGGHTPQVWEVRGDEDRFSVYDAGSLSYPFLIEESAPTYSLRIDGDGNIGLGTTAARTIGSVFGTGRFLNLNANGAAAATGVAVMVAQGKLGSQLHLVHTDAPDNQRIVRFQCSGGAASFHVVNDNLAAYAVANALTIKMNNGNIGLKVAAPTHPLHLSSGAHCTAGGVWTNASSRALKQQIEPITTEQAREAVRGLRPVGYRYKTEPSEQYVGFIAEDVPELVATSDRKSLAAMDITAVLTRVVQDQDELLTRQQQTIETQRRLLDKLTDRLASVEQTLEQDRSRPTE